MANPANRWLRHPGTLLSGLAALGLLGYAALAMRPKPAIPLTLTAGHLSTTRGLFLAVLAHETASRLVVSAGVLEALDAVEAGDVDAALVPGAIRFERWPHLRQVTPLFVEPLHLLVKQELYDAVAKDIRMLRGRSIALGAPDTLCYWLADDLLDFVGVGSEWRALAVPGSDAERIEQRVGALLDARRDALPDAVFNLGMLPAPVARALFGELRYRILPLPFAEAFAQSRFILGTRPDERPSSDHPLAVQREFVHDAAIPAFAYQVEPAVPPRRIHTLGTRLLVVAHEDVDSGAVERFLERSFHTRVARVMSPPLTPELLSLPHELMLHPGTVSYRRRNEPLITGASADLVGNVVSIGGALIGGTLFVGQWLHTRRRQRRHEIFDGYIRRVATIERRASEIELSAELTLTPLLELQRELARVRGEALERFLSGDLDDRTLLSELLEYASSCREVLGRLILHVRDELDERSRETGS